MADMDLSTLPSDLIRTAVCEIIEEKLKSKNYIVQIHSASKEGENNFIGVVYRVSFNRVGGTDESNEKYHLILKVAPQHPIRRSEFRSRFCFLREIYMYNEVLPYFRQFEESKGLILEENSFVEYPKCYRTIDVDPSESVLLEDLSANGFEIIDRHTQEVTYDHVRLIMQTLGKFHAISFALKDQQPDKFQQLTSSLEELFIRRDDPKLRDYFMWQLESVKNVVSSDEDAHLLAKVMTFFEQHPMDITADCLDLKYAGSASVITHGDTWQNNTMFKYDSNKKPIEVQLIDWQISRHSSPIIDIVYFMFCCTTKELRDEHYDNLLKIYHESLTKHIERLGSDPERLFPFKTMLEHFHKFAKFGLVMASMLLPVMTTVQGNGIDLDQIAEDFKDGKKMETNVFISDKSRDKFTKRMRDVIVDMVRLDYI